MEPTNAHHTHLFPVQVLELLEKFHGHLGINAYSHLPHEFQELLAASQADMEPDKKIKHSSLQLKPFSSYKRLKRGYHSINVVI